MNSKSKNTSNSSGTFHRIFATPSIPGPHPTCPTLAPGLRSCFVFRSSLSWIFQLRQKSKDSIATFKLCPWKKRTNKSQEQQDDFRTSFGWHKSYWYKYKSKAPCNLHLQNANIKTNIKTQAHFRQHLCVFNSSQIIILQIYVRAIQELLTLKSTLNKSYTLWIFLFNETSNNFRKFN